MGAVPSAEYLCDICGSPAVAFFRNLRETWPTRDVDGTWWAQWEYSSTIQNRCRRHSGWGKETPRRMTLDTVREYIHSVEETGDYQ